VRPGEATQVGQRINQRDSDSGGGTGQGLRGQRSEGPVHTQEAYGAMRQEHHRKYGGLHESAPEKPGGR